MSPVCLRREVPVSGGTFRAKRSRLRGPSEAKSFGEAKGEEPGRKRGKPVNRRVPDVRPSGETYREPLGNYIGTVLLGDPGC
jgi:hypothetical protein